jgi:pterin-4a-carbinolamine dehydratase
LFGDKKISTSALRHTYLTDKYGGSIDLINEVAQTLVSMGSSPAVLNEYVKI